MAIFTKEIETRTNEVGAEQRSEPGNNAFVSRFQSSAAGMGGGTPDEGW